MLSWELTKAVFSEFKETVLLLAGELQGPDASGRGFPPVQPLGIRAVPVDPDVDSSGNQGEGAGLLVCWDGSDGFCMPTSDPRALERIPQGQKGSVCVYSSGPKPSYYLIEGDGSHQALAQYPDGSKAHALVMEVHQAGQENVGVMHGDGHGMKLLPGRKLVIHNATGDAYIELNDDGITLNGNVKLNGGIVLGNPASGVPLATKTDLDTLLAAINATLAAGLAVAGPKATLAAPMIVSMPGTTKASASP